MVVRNVRVLLEKLNHHCTKATEAAVGMCAGRGHYELMWEHVLLQLLDSTDNDVAHILRHLEIEPGEMVRAASLDTEQLPSGSSARPTFSPVLVEMVERAWTLASLVYRKGEITSGALFVAALGDMQRAFTRCAAKLRHVDSGRLTADLPAIVASSFEQRDSTTGQLTETSSNGLRRFCRNMTNEARAGRVDPILGRCDEIRQMLDVLCRRRKNNPILVGDAGVGKTAVVEGLALRIAAGDVPDTLEGVDLWELDLGLLQAGASVKGEFEKRLKSVVDAAGAAGGGIILFIDEAHTLIGAGGDAGTGDAANLLKPALARGELRTCAATTWLEYHKYFEKDPALSRRFQMIKVAEPDEEKACAMLRGIAGTYACHHGVHITDDAIRAAVSLSKRYIAGRQLPDKAIDVLDTACTRARMSRATTPPQLDSARGRLADARRTLATLNKDSGMGIPAPAGESARLREATLAASEEVEALTAKWETETRHAREITRALEELGKRGAGVMENEDSHRLREHAARETSELVMVQGDTPMVFTHVSRALCAGVVADWTGIPVSTMIRDEARMLLDLERLLGNRVIGQVEAVGEVAGIIRSARVGTNNPDAPLGVFLFTGPSGVGKTELALAMADTLFGGDKFATTINMSEYQERHSLSQLKGSPPGYVGYGEGGVLTEAVRRKPYSLVILDEVEKAHRDVLNMFYQVFDKGVMRDGEGRDIDFRNTVIVMTCNLGADSILRACHGGNSPSGHALTEAIRPELQAHFQPALLARCRVVPFHPLNEHALSDVVHLKLTRIAERLKQSHGIDLAYAPGLAENLAGLCTAAETGARNIDTMVNGSLLPSISKGVLGQLGRDETESQRVSVGMDESGCLTAVFANA